MTGRAATRDEKLVAWVLWALAFAALWSTEAAVGFTRDESVYFAAAEGYASWFRLLVRAPAQAFTDSAIVRAWDYNHEHPVLMKTLFGLSHMLFHDGLGLRDAVAFRIPAFAMAALVPALCFLFGSALYGRTAGMFAALSFLLVPRQYFNAELACFDMPVAAMWLLVVYCFWRALEDTRWGIACGVAFGLALATKHNALFLPFVLTPFALWRAWTASEGSPEARVRLGRFVGLFATVAVLYGLLVVALGGGAAFQKKFLLLSPHTLFFVGLAVGSVWLLRDLAPVSPPVTRALVPVAAMAVLGPVLFYLHWPYLWHAPVDRTAWYLAFHATHNHYAWFYLGTLMRGPPFPLTYVLVKTALTVPTSLFAPMVTGLLALAGRALLSLSARTRGWVRMPTATEALVGVNAVTSILVISHPQVPHFGGVKHWFPSMPFLGILAGAAVARGCFALWEVLKTRRPTLPSFAVTVPVFALLLLPALLGLVRVFPYGTAAYSELAGGLPGAATLGMQRQFWSSHVTGVLPWINEHAKPGARIYLHEVNGFSFRDYQRDGMLRPDVRAVSSPFDADIVAYQYHQEFREHEFLTWQAFGTRTPVTGLYLDETPQVIVYQRPE